MKKPGLVGPEERQLVAAVVHDGVEGDDEVPHPGGRHVAPREEGPDTYGCISSILIGRELQSVKIFSRTERSYYRRS